jgi:type II secretory pathway pseudopilin PulG
MTMVEMMVVTILLAIVGGSVMSVLARQQQFYRSTSDVMDLRSQMRQGAAVLAGDLRGVSSVGGDIVSMGESSIDFYANIGSSIVCSIVNTTTVILPPLTLTNGTVLSTWISRPARDDSVFVYSDPDTTNSGDDTWERFALDTVIAENGACNTTYTQPSDNSNASYRLRINSSGPSMTSFVRKGSTIRFTRRVKYQVYQSGTDSRWYLGYCSPTCTSTNPIQPIAGPFNPIVSGSGTSGIRFTYYDENGNVIAGNTASERASVARISFVLRGQSRGQINVAGMGKGYYTDSLRTEVALRNRS